MLHDISDNILPMHSPTKTVIKSTSEQGTGYASGGDYVDDGVPGPLSN